MKAGILNGKNDIKIGQMSDPVIGPDDALLESHAAGICGEFPRAIQMMSRGLLHPDLLITSVQPPGDITRAFEQVDRKNPNTIKVV